MRCFGISFLLFFRRVALGVCKNNKLQKLMIDNQMKRQDLMRAAEITSYAATKINKNEPVSLEVLMRICQVFHCDIGDICEVILDED